MIFEIPFNEQILKEQLTLNFDVTWKENLRKNKQFLFWSVPLVLLGSFVVYSGDKLGYISIAIGIHYVWNFFNYYYYYKKSEKTYFDLVASEIDQEKEAQQNAIWNFDQDCLGVKNHKYEVKIKWKAFNTYRIIENNLFLDINAGTTLSYIIGEKEIGSEKYNHILAFIKDKIPQK